MLYVDYNFVELDNIVYTIDMMRIRCNIDFLTFDKLQSRIKIVYPDMIKNFYTSTRYI